MGHFRRRILLNSFKFADVLILIFSFALAMLCVQRSGSASLEQFLAMRISVANFVLFLGMMLLWQGLFTSMGLYYSMRLSSRRAEIVDIVKAVSLGTLAIYVLANMFNITVVTPLFLVVFWFTNLSLTLASRFILRYFLGHVRTRGRNLRHILLVGTNERALQFGRMILSKPQLGYSLVGFVDTHWLHQDEQLRGNYPLVHPEQLADFLKDTVVDEVMLCLPLKEYYEQHEVITETCAEQGVIVRVLADFFFSQLANARVEYFEGSSILTIYTGTMGGLPLLFKRLIDIVLSLILLILLAPLFLAVAIFIKLSSPGPVFFVQDRLGLNKRIFKLYKFRTMVQGAEKMQQELEELNEADGPVFKIKKDPRITREGQFLRKTSIDELPQLLNVLKGDMSLVGPRPLPIRDYKGFAERWFNRRFSVRPGMTCIWQVDGRSDLSFEKWIQLDLRYIDSWSLLLDFQLLLRTIPAVLKGRGAS